MLRRTMLSLIETQPPDWTSVPFSAFPLRLHPTHSALPSCTHIKPHRPLLTSPVRRRRALPGPTTMTALPARDENVQLSTVRNPSQTSRHLGPCLPLPAVFPPVCTKFSPRMRAPFAVDVRVLPPSCLITTAESSCDRSSTGTAAHNCRGNRGGAVAGVSKRS